MVKRAVPPEQVVQHLDDILRSVRPALAVVWSDDQPTHAVDACAPFERAPVDYEVDYRLALPGSTIATLTPKSPIDVACARIKRGSLMLAPDLRFVQRWKMRAVKTADLATSISLAPRERLTITIRKTQRTQLTETTMRSSESIDSFESGLVDKEVLNVQRNAVHSNQWRVDGNASVSMGGVTVGASGGATGSVQSTANRAAERLHEATRKSSRRLQALQKIEVARQTESTVERGSTRTIENPYTDRSLTLNVYELAKEYRVDTALADIRPLLILEVTDLELGARFVLSNGGFLDEELLDRMLAGELREALAAARDVIPAATTPDLDAVARRALDWLFTDDAGSVFGFLDAGENDPTLSFPNQDAFEHAKDNGGFSAFAVIAAFRYLNQQAARPDDVSLASALADALAPIWDAVPPESLQVLVDFANHTEVLRRVPGFLAIVNQVLRPRVERGQGEALDQAAFAAESARRRAETAVARVAEHLECNKAYYVHRFLQYSARTTQGHALAAAVEAALAAHPVAGLTTALFPPGGAFLDGLQIVVPLVAGLPLPAGIAMMLQCGWADAPDGEELRPFVAEQVRVPADGYHLEPVAGRCVLDGVPAEPAQSVAVKIDASRG